jgi:hypothetical protein
MWLYCLLSPSSLCFSIVSSLLHLPYVALSPHFFILFFLHCLCLYPSPLSCIVSSLLCLPFEHYLLIYFLHFLYLTLASPFSIVSVLALSHPYSICVSIASSSYLSLLLYLWHSLLLSPPSSPPLSLKHWVCLSPSSMFQHHSSLKSIFFPVFHLSHCLLPPPSSLFKHCSLLSHFFVQTLSSHLYISSVFQCCFLLTPPSLCSTVSPHLHLHCFRTVSSCLFFVLVLPLHSSIFFVQ